MANTVSNLKKLALGSLAIAIGAHILINKPDIRLVNSAINHVPSIESIFPKTISGSIEYFQKGYSAGFCLHYGGRDYLLNPVSAREGDGINDLVSHDLYSAFNLANNGEHTRGGGLHFLQESPNVTVDITAPLNSDSTLIKGRTYLVPTKDNCY